SCISLTAGARYGHNTDFLSSPTRRSSDLLAADQGDGRSGDGGGQPAELLQLRVATDHDRAEPGPGDQHAGQATHRAQPTGTGNRDRKSTRLNSSHAKSSYAVFCLNNKKLT